LLRYFLIFRLVGCNIAIMKRFLSLFILTGLLFGQDVLHLKSGELYTGTFYGKVGEDIVFKVEGETSTKKFSINDVEIIKIKSGELSYPFSVTNSDILILKDGTTYFGEYSKIEGKIVFFKPQDAFGFQPVPVKLIQTLKLKDGHFIIGDVLTYEEYQKEHIENAIFFDLEKYSNQQKNLPHNHFLPKKSDWEKTLSEMGVSNDDKIVIYDNSDLITSCRCWFQFLYFGHRS